MVQKTAVTPNSKAIHAALEQLVADDPAAIVDVFASNPPFVRAVVVSDTFTSMNVAQRQDHVWKHLEQALRPEMLQDLMGVHLYTRPEFERLEG